MLDLQPDFTDVDQLWTVSLISKICFATDRKVTLVINLRLSRTRHYAAGVYDSQHGFVVTGGWGSTVERTFDGINFSSFPDMPAEMGGHCLVSLMNGNLLAVGGAGNFMFEGSNNSWTTMQSMPSSTKSGKY